MCSSTGSGQIGTKTVNPKLNLEAYYVASGKTELK